MMHSLDLKAVAREAKARKCAAEVAGNVQAKVERQHRLLISFPVIPPSRSIPQRYTEMCVICSHNFAGMVSFMWCQDVKAVQMKLPVSRPGLCHKCNANLVEGCTT